MRILGILLLAALNAAAQSQTGRVEGVVTDAASHQPIRKAEVMLLPAGGELTPQSGRQMQNTNPQSGVTDSSGGFAFGDLPAGRYQLRVSHPNYPQARFGALLKFVQVSGGGTAARRVNVELLPGAAISGHILDEDGDPLRGCFPQLQPVSANQGVQYRNSKVREDGSYLVSGILPGKYFLGVECHAEVFHPRPLSEGPDPPPSFAYAPQYYPAAKDMKSAEVLDLSPGMERSALDLQMRPAPVTHIYGKIAGTADWRGSVTQITLSSADSQNGRMSVFTFGAKVDQENGTFDITRVFPGSYKLVAFTPRSARGKRKSESGGGAVMYVQVADRPVEANLPFHSALEIHGQIQVEPGKDAPAQNTFSTYSVQLVGNEEMTGVSDAQVAEDGSFILKSVFPGHEHLQLSASNGFLKSASYGGVEVKDGELDLTSGIAAPLQIVVSMNTGTIRGTAPAGLMVFARSVDDRRAANAPADASGHFVIQNLAPGKYRLAALPEGAEMPEDGSQEVTVAEGETATVDVRATDNP